MLFSVLMHDQLSFVNLPQIFHSYTSQNKVKTNCNLGGVLMSAEKTQLENSSVIPMVSPTIHANPLQKRSLIFGKTLQTGGIKKKTRAFHSPVNEKMNDR